MQSEQFTLVSNDGKELHAHCWSPENARAVVCLIHGFGEHIGRYHHVAQHLVNQGIAVFGHDQRGHGQTKGKRGHAQIEGVLNDVEALMKSARVAHLDLPMFLYGHSWGGNIVANYLLRRNISELTGGILTSPWFALSFEPPSWQISLGKLMASVFPGFTQNTKLNIEHLSRDLQVGQDYLADPLVHGKLSAGLFLETMDSGQYALAHSHKLKLPTLLMHGTDDQITSCSASEQFAQGSDRVTFKKWPEMRHETHNEVGKESVLQYLNDWLISQLD